MPEWTPEATQYLEGYMQMVRSLASTRGEDAEDIVSGLQEHIQVKVEETAGPIVTLDTLQRVLAEVGSPEQILAAEIASPTPRKAEAPPPPVPPVRPQYVQVQRPDRSSRMLRWVIAFAILVVLAVFLIPIFGIVAAIVIPSLSRAHEAADRASCQNNLKQIGMACKMFADDHDGAWPERIEDLYPEFMSDPEILQCPSSNQVVGGFEDATVWTSYLYIPGYREGGGDDVIVCVDKLDNHIPPGRNVLYSNGRVEFMRSEDLPELPILTPKTSP